MAVMTYGESSIQLAARFKHQGKADCMTYDFQALVHKMGDAVVDEPSDQLVAVQTDRAEVQIDCITPLKKRRQLLTAGRAAPPPPSGK